MTLFSEQFAFLVTYPTDNTRP